MSTEVGASVVLLNELSMSDHPEVDAENSNSLEPTIGECFRLEEFKRGIDKIENIDELREIAKLLAQQAMMLQPAAIRYLAKEAARNLTSAAGKDWTAVASEMREHLTGQSE